jgi:thiol-disulfide isomerase/thioredoxin
MNRYKKWLLPLLLITALAVWLGRSRIRNMFPPGLGFYTVPLTVVDDGRTMTLADFKEKVIIVSCYQTWCKDCAKETPVLNQLAENIGSSQFKVLYISDEDTAKVNRFRRRFASANILFTRCAGSMDKLGISAYPTTYLLNKNGQVVKTKLEGYNWLQEEPLIRKMIAE